MPAMDLLPKMRKALALPPEAEARAGRILWLVPDPETELFAPEARAAASLWMAATLVAVPLDEAAVARACGIPVADLVRYTAFLAQRAPVDVVL